MEEKIMTLEETIQEMYDRYPNLYQTRKECLNYLFCTNGIDYEWHDGELISGHRINMVFDYKEDECVIESIDNTPIKLKGNGFSLQDVEPDETYLLIRKLKPFSWYPLSKYSKLKNYPKDIKPDWKKGIDETIKLLKEDGIDVNEYNFK